MSAQSWGEWFNKIAREAKATRREKLNAQAEWEEWMAPIFSDDTRVIVDSFLWKIRLTRKWED